MVVNVFFSAVTQATLSRHELLAWVNDCLQANLTKIEEMATGAAYCGLTDLLFPGSCQLKKVKWNSRHEVDWINNWRVLQGSWKQLGVDKPVPVEKLLKAKFQENFEFLQWFKKFFDANYEEHDYDAVSARGGEEFPAVLPGGKAPPPARAAPRPAAAPSRPAVQSTTRRSAGITSAPQKSTAAAPQKPATITQKAPSFNNSNGSSGVNVAAIEEKYKKQLEELIQENATLAESVTGLEKERDFYFNKLRAVEILCTEIGEDAHVETKRITNILYETEDGCDAEVAEEHAEIQQQQESPIPPVEEHTNGKTNGHSNHDEKEITPKEEKVHDVAQKAAEINLDDSETF
jgi:RP/EB family microtubule-associated protein